MEPKKEIKQEEKKSNLTLDNRKRMVLSGVLDVVSFNEEQIILNTSLGRVNIKGGELKMNKLDVQNGDIIITGHIDSFVYSGIKDKKKKESILVKMFK